MAGATVGDEHDEADSHWLVYQRYSPHLRAGSTCRSRYAGL